MICKNCGYAANNGAKFCRRCGAVIADNQGGAYVPAAWDNQPKESYIQPYVPQYSAENPHPAKRTSVGKIIGSVVLAFFFFIMFIASVNFTAFKFSFNRDTVTEIIRGADIADTEIEIDGVTKTVGDAVYEMIPAEMRTEDGVSREEFNDILNDNSLKDDFAGVIGLYIDHLMGNKTSTVTADDIVNIIRQHEDMVYDKSGYRMNDVDYAVIRMMLNSEELKPLTTDGADKLFSGINLGSVITVIYIVVIFFTLLFAGLIVLINKSHLSHSLLYCGIPVLITGILTTLSSLSSSDASVISTAFKPMMSMLLIIGIASIGVGVIMVLCYIPSALARKKKFEPVY